MSIITIGREFGSGGRELGKRLADELGVPCYDKEIISEIAKLKGVSPDRVESISNADIRKIYSYTIGRTLMSPAYVGNDAASIFFCQQEVIKKLASEGDCVVVGRNADVVLRDMNPLNLFVYADEESKVKRCMERAEKGESVKDILKQMRKIDKSRASNRALITDTPWGEKETYHLCINTSGVNIKSLVPALAQYVRAYAK